VVIFLAVTSVALLVTGALGTPLLPSGSAGELEDTASPGLDDIVISKHRATPQDIQFLKQKMGTYEGGRTYNVIIDGHGTGLAPPTEEGWQDIASQAYIVDNITRSTGGSTPDGAPASVDNSQDVWFPPIGDQDGEGSCVCFAVGYYTKTYQEAREHNWDLSGAVWEGGYYDGHPSPAYQDRIMSPDFIYHQILYWYGNDGGSTYSDAMNLIHRIGCSSWESMPYDPTDSTSWPGEAAWREAPLYRGQSGYNYAYVKTDTALESLKTYLSGDHLAVISINASYYSSLTSSDLWTVDNYIGSGTNHANTIVGYDDNFGPYTEEGATRYGAFKVANSWGTGGWENIADGFYWISYEAMKREVEYYMFMEDRVGYEPSLLSVFDITHDKRTECDISVGMGSPSMPLMEKDFNDWYFRGAPSPFPSNHMVLDISEFADSYDIDGQNFFLRVYDGGTTATGTITNFTIEYYDTYTLSGNPTILSSSPGTPVNTVHQGTRYASTTLEMSSPPSVSTQAATAVNTTSAQLNGNLVDLGGETSCDVWFVYDTVEHTSWQDYAHSTSPASKSGTGSFSQVVDTLQPDTTYHFRAVASNTAGTSQGDDGSFSTDPLLPPSVSTQAASDIDLTSAQLNGDLVDLGTDDSCQVWFVYDTVQHTGWQDYAYSTPSSPMSAPASFNHVVGSLQSGTTYHYRAVASNAQGTSQGDEAMFATASNAAPVANFTFTPSNPYPGDTVSFTDVSTDPDGIIVNWTWDFDDGHTGYEQNPGHAYDASGIYTVTLTVTDDQGAADSTSKQVTVYSSQWNTQSNPPHSYIIPEGNVGIGTDTPTDKLHVNGSFRVESNPMTHLFFVDASTDRIGIGTGSPAAMIHARVEGNAAQWYEAITSNYSFWKAQLNFMRARGTAAGREIVQNNDWIGSLEYKGWDGGTYRTGARLYAIVDGSPGSNDMPARFIFATTPDGSGSPQDRFTLYGTTGMVVNEPGLDYDFRVESTGNTHLLFVDASSNYVGIGTSTPQRALHINDVMRLEPRTSAPGGAAAGDLYFDSTIGKLMCYDGTTWQACW